MSQLAVGWKTLYQEGQGREQRTDGLWNHLGTLRIGSGLAVASGPVDLPAGSIDTPEIAFGAVQQVLGQYFGDPNWSSPLTGQWVESAVSSGMLTCTGAVVRVEACLTVKHSAANGTFYAALGMDALGASHTTQVATPPVAGNPMAVTLIWYTVPVAGAHRFGVWVYGITAGTITLGSVGHCSLYVTEQRR